MERESRHFYSLKEPRIYVPQNAVSGHVTAGMLVSGIDDALGQIQNFVSNKSPSQASRESRIESAIYQLMNDLEHLSVIFPELAQEPWFYDCSQAAAKIWWRVEASQFADKPDVFLAMLKEMQEHFSGTPGRSFGALLEGYFAKDAPFFEGKHKAHDFFKDDLAEANDLVLGGYPGTALFVMGRAVDRAIYEIGVKHRVERVRFSDGKTKDWDDAAFAIRARAARKIPVSGPRKFLLDKRRHAALVILIEHRNSLAHVDYSTQEDSETERGLHIAMGLVEHLGKEMTRLSASKRIKAIREITIGEASADF